VAFDLYAKFMLDAYGLAEEECADEAHQNELSGLLWFWAELSSGTKHLAYNQAAEHEVDCIIQRWAVTLGKSDMTFSDDCLRVIAERVSQKLVVCQKPQMQKIQTIVPPRNLHLETRQCLTGILWVHGADLPLNVSPAISKRERWERLNAWRP
jgi:hypothetical protein